MKSLIFFALLFFFIRANSQQQSYRDSLLTMLAKTKADTTRVNILVELSGLYQNSNPDSQFVLAHQGLQLAQSIGYIKGELNCKDKLAGYWWAVGDYATSINLYLPRIEYAKENKDTLGEMFTYIGLVNSYRDQGDYKEALHYSFASLEIIKRLNNDFALGMTNAIIGSVYYGMSNLDSADYYLNKAVNYPHTLDMGWIYLIYGRIKAKQKNINAAFDFYRQSIEILKYNGNVKDLTGAYVSIGELFKEIKQTDSAIVYGKLALNFSKEQKFNKELLQSYLLLANAYEKTDNEKAVEFYHLAMDAKDGLFSQDKQRQISSYKFNKELQQQEIKNIQQQSASRNRTYLLLAVLTSFLLFVIFLVRNNKQKEKVNIVLREQKQKVESTLTELKSTQAQLIQSEKMASLGELTAGIAHEIQNPLNFVNNFSDVNKELLEELEQEADKGNIAEVKAIAIDIKENEQKINHHGKRADAIVKGMLQHSRSSSGVKEPTDINALCDEYLRLSYHGLRAKDKSLSAGQ
ncbi:MAG TPA: hypothetical protein VGP47_05500, partial [Parachlamydiaceae bacterium]|nr:hypothetical protein [Parachlamydiaceae bacterium]